MFHTVTWCSFREDEVGVEWDSIWRHATFHYAFPFRSRIIICWSLKLVQLAIALAESLPIPSELPGVHYEICSDRDRTYTTQYHTLSTYGRQNHGAALMA